MEKQITAVEWLVKQLEDVGINLDFELDIIFQAKEMEKEQIISAFMDSKILCDF